MYQGPAGEPETAGSRADFSEFSRLLGNDNAEGVSLN